MSDVQNPPVVDPTEQSSGLEVSQTPIDNKVSFESHEKLLNEKKKLQTKHRETEAELEKFREAERLREQKDLESKGEYDKILISKDDEINKLRDNLSMREKQDVETRKLSSFLNTVEGEVDKKFWGLIDINAIAINPDTGEIDQLSVAKAVETFRGQYPETIRGRSVPNLPNQAPSNGQATLSYEEWTKLPYKEKLERFKEVYQQ